MYALNQSVEWSFVLNDIEDGARNADSTPTVTLYRNGASDPASVNVTNPTSGRYLCTFTIPVGWSLGDDFFAVATAVVDGVTFLVEVGRGRIGAVATDASGNALATASSVAALPSAAAIASAVWSAGTRTLSGFGTLIVDIWAGLTSGAGNKIADHVRRRTQANVEASSDGDALDLSSQYGMIQMAQESSRSGTVLTVRKTDGSTTLGTKTLTSSPTAEPITGVT